jgi:hypothetical protein
MFVVVRVRADRIHEVKEYLYNGQKIVTEPVLNEFGSAMVIVESAHGMSGKMLADRVGTALMGASQFQTREEADAYVESEMG